uniref:Uncharacterized protein MANES_12G084500 n=1 Tax=Rhizophora mucronata TaxID=61149 RepID=A0A2P2PCN5_RHIMU
MQQGCLHGSTAVSYHKKLPFSLLAPPFPSDHLDNIQLPNKPR